MVRVGRLELPASCSQSKRATNCATPGYEIFQLWSNMWSTPIFDQLSARVKVLSAQVSQGFPGFPRAVARTRASRSQRDMISNHYSTRGGDLSVPCLSYFTKLQSNVKPSLRGRSWSPIVQLQRQTRRYTLPEDNSKDSLPVRTPWLRTKQMPPHRSTFSPPNLHNDEPYEPPA